jgi:microcystin-dependent protein
LPTPFLSEIRVFTFNFAPRGWAFCNGQVLPINQNQALFALLGTTFGGNGTSTFALPNLQGRVPMHQSNQHVLGQAGGEVAHTLLANEIPLHNHIVNGSGNTATVNVPTGNYLAKSSANVYAPASSGNTSLMPATVATVGGSAPHDNMSPYLVLNFCIALQGIFPTRT